MVSKEDKLEQLSERVVLHHNILLGAEGQGGLVREQETMKKRLAAVESKATVLSTKWLTLMTVLALLGQFGANILARYLFP